MGLKLIVGATDGKQSAIYGDIDITPNPDKPEPERHWQRVNTDEILNLINLFMFFKYRKFFAFSV
jgi:hypothetical protein